MNSSHYSEHSDCATPPHLTDADVPLNTSRDDSDCVGETEAPYFRVPGSPVPPPPPVVTPPDRDGDDRAADGVFESPPASPVPLSVGLVPPISSLSQECTPLHRIMSSTSLYGEDLVSSIRQSSKGLLPLRLSSDEYDDAYTYGTGVTSSWDLYAKNDGVTVEDHLVAVAYDSNIVDRDGEGDNNGSDDSHTSQEPSHLRELRDLFFSPSVQSGAINSHEASTTVTTPPSTAWIPSLSPPPLQPHLSLPAEQLQFAQPQLSSLMQVHHQHPHESLSLSSALSGRNRPPRAPMVHLRPSSSASQQQMGWANQPQSHIQQHQQTVLPPPPKRLHIRAGSTGEGSMLSNLTESSGERALLTPNSFVEEFLANQSGGGGMDAISFSDQSLLQPILVDEIPPPPPPPDWRESRKTTATCWNTTNTNHGSRAWSRQGPFHRSRTKPTQHSGDIHPIHKNVCNNKSMNISSNRDDYEIRVRYTGKQEEETPEQKVGRKKKAKTLKNRMILQSPNTSKETLPNSTPVTIRQFPSVQANFLMLANRFAVLQKSLSKSAKNLAHKKGKQDLNQVMPRDGQSTHQQQYTDTKRVDSACTLSERPGGDDSFSVSLMSSSCSEQDRAFDFGRFTSCVGVSCFVDTESTAVMRSFSEVYSQTPSTLSIDSTMSMQLKLAATLGLLGSTCMVNQFIARENICDGCERIQFLLACFEQLTLFAFSLLLCASMNLLGTSHGKFLGCCFGPRARHLVSRSQGLPSILICYGIVGAMTFSQWQNYRIIRTLLVSSCTLQIGVPFSTSGCFIASGVLLILKRSYLEYHLSCRLLVRYRSELAHLFRRLILLDEIALYAWDSPVSFLSTSAGVVKLIQILQSSEKLEAESDLQPGKPPSHTDMIDFRRALLILLALERLPSFPVLASGSLDDATRAIFDNLAARHGCPKDSLHIDMIIGERDSTEEHLSNFCLRVLRFDKAGNIAWVDFNKHLSLFQRGIKATLSVDKTYSMMINRTLNIAYGLMLLILMGFNALPLVLALTCLLVVLAFFLGPACSWYVEGFVLVIWRRMFDIGDRIDIVCDANQTTTVGKMDCGNQWIVEEYNLFTTSVRCPIRHESVSVANGNLARMHMIIAKRCERARIRIPLKFPFGIPLHLIKMFRKTVGDFVRDRCMEFDGIISFQQSRADVDMAYIEYVLTVASREMSYEVNSILDAKLSLGRFCLELQRQLEIRYKPPLSRTAKPTCRDSRLLEGLKTSNI